MQLFILVAALLYILLITNLCNIFVAGKHCIYLHHFNTGLEPYSGIAGRDDSIVQLSCLSYVAQFAAYFCSEKLYGFVIYVFLSCSFADSWFLLETIRYSDLFQPLGDS